MQRKSFYRALKSAAPKFKWRIKKDDTLRGIRGNRSYCPITAVHYARTGEFVSEDKVDDCQYDYLDISDAEAIVEAADEPEDVLAENKVAVRRALLRNVGLLTD